MLDALNPELIKLQVTKPEQSSPKGLFVPVVLLPSADTVFSLPHSESQPIAEDLPPQKYAVVFMDAIHFHVRSEGQIIKKAVYIAIGINMDGQKEVLGMWVGENESAKFWLSVLNSIKARGVEDILIACIDLHNECDRGI